ncbi:MAG: 2TM domain-containing protein [Bacteroidales bacterium]|jgi:type VI protein secretion system component VasK|nr:2TM domain-containing protein [Bacteroidales bacterium]
MKEDKIIGEDFSLPEETEIVKKAKKRVGFKIHIIIYILACILIWLCWVFIFHGSNLNKPAFNAILFITLAWGICIIFHYLIVYKWDKTYLEKEVKRLKKQQEKQQQQIEDYSNQDKI